MNRVRVYLVASGVALALLAAFGTATVATGNPTILGLFLIFDNTHNALHAILAVVALGAGLAPLPERYARWIAAGLGTLYIALGVLGMLHARLYGYPARMGMPIQLELVENVLHFILGAWGAYVGTQDAETTGA